MLTGAGYGNELLIVLKVLPIFGPSKRITAITTIATSARMIAYSTSPWPFSLGANNIVNSFLIEYVPEDLPQNFPQYIHFDQNFNPHIRGSVYKIVNIKKDFLTMRKSFCSILQGNYRELLIELNVLPILGPSKRTTAITTMATSTRIIAYSTSPCPCSLADNNIMSSFLNIYSASKNRKRYDYFIILFSFCS